MKKKWLILSIVFIRIIYSNAQDDILRMDDSLNHLLHQNIKDTSKTKTYQALIELWKVRDFNKVIFYIKEAIEFCEKAKPRINPDGFKAQLGFQYMQVGDAVRSIEVFNELSKTVESSNQEYFQMTQAFIAMNYENLGDIQKALEYQLIGSSIMDRLLLHDSIQDRRGILGNPHKLAVYYMKLNKLDSALQYGLAALEALHKEPLNDYNRFFSWYIKTAMGDIYTKLKEYGKAIESYNQADAEIRKYNSKEDIPPLYLGRARMYYQLHQLQQAANAASLAYHVADTLKLNPMIIESSNFLKTVFKDLHKYDSAMIYSEIAIATKDTILNANIARKIDALEYAEQKRKQEIATLKNEKLFKKNLFYLSGVALIILFLAGFLFQQNRLKQKANQVLLLENKEVLAQREHLKHEVERFEIEALKAQLNPHFIFNCLNSIDAFIYSNDKYKATTYLNKFAKLLRNILDSSKNNTVSLEQDIQSLQLYTELEELRNDHRFKTIYHIDENVISNNYVVPPLIIQPLVENAILHGLKNRKEPGGKLEISMKIINNQLEYEIIDNGIGRVAASQYAQPKEHSYGMELTRSRIKLFNQNREDKLKLEDIVDQGKVIGTKVSFFLSLQTAII